MKERKQAFIEIPVGCKSVDRTCRECKRRFYVFAPDRPLLSPNVSWPNAFEWLCAHCKRHAEIMTVLSDLGSGV